MWELPIHWDRDGRLILYNLAMIIFFRPSFSSLREFMSAVNVTLVVQTDKISYCSVLFTFR